MTRTLGEMTRTLAARGRRRSPLARMLVVAACVLHGLSRTGACRPPPPRGCPLSHTLAVPARAGERAAGPALAWRQPCGPAAASAGRPPLPSLPWCNAAGLARGLCGGGSGAPRPLAAAALLARGPRAHAGPRGCIAALRHPCGVLLPHSPVLALRGAGTHDGKRKKRKKMAAKLAARDSVQALREGAALRAKRAKEKEAFRLRMARRRQERELAAQEEEDSEDDGAGFRYAMTLPAEERQKILDELRALEPPLPDMDNPEHEVPRLTDAELLGGLKPPAQPLPFGLGGAGDGGSRGTGGAGRRAAPARKGSMLLYDARG